MIDMGGERHPDARDPVEPVAHKPCPCGPCKDWRGAAESNGGCFVDVMFRSGTGGHGPCVDTWGQGCVCTGTAADGECEACWLWLK